MPEGDTIRRTADAVRARVLGATVREAEPAALHPLRGRALAQVEAVGKHLLMRFDGGLALHTHMRMTGAWHLYRPGEPWRRPAHRARAVLRFDTWVAVLFSAPVVELVRDEASVTGHLGPDILGEELDLDAVVARARTAADPTVGELLLDQRVCAGIGNIYKCETLWRHRLDPWTAPAAIDDAMVGALYRTARDLMRHAVVARPQPRAVHGRGGRPCPRCGGRISVRSQGDQGRLTYFCPRCQAAAAAPSPGRVRPRGAV